MDLVYLMSARLNLNQELSNFFIKNSSSYHQKITKLWSYRTTKYQIFLLYLKIFRLSTFLIPLKVPNRQFSYQEICIFILMDKICQIITAVDPLLLNIKLIIMHAIVSFKCYPYNYVTKNVPSVC